MLTPEQVMATLGLRPWDQQKEIVQKWREEHPDALIPDIRMTGRTTRMLVTLFVAVSYGMVVCIKASSREHEKLLTHDAKEVAVRLGLPPRNIVMNDGPGVVEFHDHTFWEKG